MIGERRYFESAEINSMIHPGVAGSPINVYVGPQDDSNYYVDVSACK